MAVKIIRYPTGFVSVYSSSSLYTKILFFSIKCRSIGLETENSALFIQ